MNDDISLSKVPLSSLNSDSRDRLFLLDTEKVLLSDGPNKLPRDWRGLAYLVNITNEGAAKIQRSSDKTKAVLDIWIQKNDGTATIQQLLDYLMIIDRYDIYDDLLENAKNGTLTEGGHRPSGQILLKHDPVQAEESDPHKLITYDDRSYGIPQYYNAFVLYAKEDQEFVDELLTRMRNKGFKMCTEDDLVPGLDTRYKAVSRLMSMRCYRIILVLSPDFFQSPANTFFTDYAQAFGIEQQRPHILPCLYRDCALPQQVSLYHRLYYSSSGRNTLYDFWEKLSLAIKMPNHYLGISSPSVRHSSVNITELEASGRGEQLLGLGGLSGLGGLGGVGMLGGLSTANTLGTLPATRSHSMNGLHEAHRPPLDTISVSSESSDKSKKSKTLSQLFKNIKIKSKEKKRQVEN